MAFIVLVEDNPLVRSAFATGLEHRGHEVTTAANEADLHEALAARLPDLLLLDIGLPGIDGIEILRELRTDPRTAALKVAVLSNYSDRDLIHRALALDAIEYVEKVSTTPTLLAAQVERWLEP